LVIHAKEGNYRIIKVQYYNQQGIMKKRNVSLSRLVAFAYVDNPNNFPDVDHIDEDKGNNAAENLEWVTKSENIRRSHAKGNRKSTKRPVLQFTTDGTFLKRFDGVSEAAQESGAKDISSVCKGKRNSSGGFKWRHETEDDVLYGSKENGPENEIWKEHPTHRDYQISNYGRIYSNKVNRILPPYKQKGYLYSHLDGKGYLAHRLVAETFEEEPEEKEKDKVNHKDGNKTNNSTENLEWTTTQENSQHAYEKIIKKHECIQYSLEGEEMARFSNCSDAGRKTKIHHGSIRMVCRREKKYNTAGNYIWRYISDPLREGEIDQMKKEGKI
jgi:HNH endonuclease/NUMOD4 motif/NUMOD1 domain